MQRWLLLVGGVALGLLLGYAVFLTDWFDEDVPSYPEAGGDATPVLVPFVDGLDRPVLVTHAGDERLFIVEQRGVVRIADREGGLHAYNLLDISDRVSSGGERGLLGLAFPPDHAESGAFFVHYSDRDGDTVLARFHAVDGRADADGEEVLLRVDQPYANHNGGSIAFGPDGYLYLGLGDGGLAGDPHGNGQDTHTLLGAILRLDVSGDQARAAPGNPFEDGGGDPRVWHYGLRNPWRFSFDADGDLWIGDVGQDGAEEIDRAPAGSSGLNFGWSVYEGSARYKPGTAEGHVPPVAEYDHDGGHCSVTAGYVWDHPDAGALRGTFVFGDYCSGTVWSHDPDAGDTVVVARLDARVSSFGEDAAGRLYVVDHGGVVSRMET